jgi:hypothetical protein
MGCNNDGLAPPFLSTDLAMTVEADMAVEDSGPPAVDLEENGDLAKQCVSACGCSPGQQCVQPNGVCGASAPPVFCCGAATCTGSSFCEAPAGSLFSQCNAPPDAGLVPLTGGNPGSCPSRVCTPGAAGDQLCQLACGRNNATCAGAPPHCMP